MSRGRVTEGKLVLVRRAGPNTATARRMAPPSPRGLAGAVLGAARHPPSRIAPAAQLGDSNVGKSSLVLRFVKNQFNADQVTTVGAAFLQCPVAQEDSDDKIQFGIWDTAGSERYKALAPMVRASPPATGPSRVEAS